MAWNPSSSEQVDIEGDDPALGFPEPSQAWKFNIFLNHIAEQITDDEFQKVKHQFTDIIGKRVLEKCQDIFDVFNIMRQETFLSNDNLLYLQSLIFLLRRADLLEKCIEYSKRQGNVLHFYCPPDEPATGHDFVKIHVEGKDFVNCSPRYLKKLRNAVAGIVFIPEENVFFAGVEPSSSMLITLMIPSSYVGILQKMLIGKENMEELVEIGVDVIGIGDKQYNIRGIEEAEIILTEEQTNLVNVYQQLQTKSKLLEDLELECLQLSKKINVLEEGNLTEKNMLSTLRRMFHNVLPAALPLNGYQPATLASQAALTEFQNALREVGMRGYDKELIFVLLETNTDMVVNRLREEFHLSLDKFKIEANGLRSQIVPLTVALEKYQFLVQVNSGELDEILFESLVNAVERKLKTAEGISISIQIMNASKKISNQMRLKEKRKLMDKYKWTKEDPFTEALEKEPGMFLNILYLKEVERTETVLDPVEFFTSSLTEVGRKDLAVKLNDLLKQSSKSVSQKQGKARGRVPEIKSPRDKSSGRGKGSRDSETQVDSVDVSGQLKVLSEKVDSICNQLESLQGKPPSYESMFPGRYPGYTKRFNAQRRHEMNICEQAI